MFIMDFQIASSLKNLLNAEFFCCQKKMIFKDANLIYYHANQNLWSTDSVPEISCLYYLWFLLLYLKLPPPQTVL